MRYLLGHKSFCHHVDIKATIHFSFSWKVNFVFIVVCPFIIPPPSQDEVLVILD